MCSLFSGRIHITCFYPGLYLLHLHLSISAFHLLVSLSSILEELAGGLADKSENKLYIVSNKPYLLPINRLICVECLRQV